MASFSKSTLPCCDGVNCVIEPSVRGESRTLHRARGTEARKGAGAARLVQVRHDLVPARLELLHGQGFAEFHGACGHVDIRLHPLLRLHGT